MIEDVIAHLFLILSTKDLGDIHTIA